MDEIKFVHLFEIEQQKIISLMNNKKVGRYLPLLTEKFTEKNCSKFLEEKQQLWDKHGFGPWAILVKDKFVGWGGLQPDQGEADFALVLHPDFWGWGLRIFNKFKDQAFDEMGFGSITILLPSKRPNFRAVMFFGFTSDGKTVIDGKTFFKFRLNNPKHSLLEI